jgi:hypothetical protein
LVAARCGRDVVSLQNSAYLGASLLLLHLNTTKLWINITIRIAEAPRDLLFALGGGQVNRFYSNGIPHTGHSSLIILENAFDAFSYARNRTSEII